MFSCFSAITILPLVFLFNSYPLVHGWGGDGHALVASIAQTLLTDESLTFIRDHLPWYTSGNLSMLASWPDNIIYPDTNPVDYLNWQWSKQLHFVDTKDWACVYDRERDCNWTSGQACVDGSIQNYTKRLADTQQDAVQRQEALKFLVHFIGDAHQPLHAGFEGDRGGNSIRGHFFGKQTNLHSLWDTVMIERRITQDFHSQPSMYLDYLVKQMQTQYAKNVTEWTNCSSSDEAEYLACATLWIVEDAKLNCDSVYRDENNQPMSVSTQFELGQTYYNTRMVIVEQRLIQAGVRLGAVINKIVQSGAKSPHPERKVSAQTVALAILVVGQLILILLLLNYRLINPKKQRPSVSKA